MRHYQKDGLVPRLSFQCAESDLGLNVLFCEARGNLTGMITSVPLPLWSQRLSPQVNHRSRGWIGGGLVHHVQCTSLQTVLNFSQKLHNEQAIQAKKHRAPRAIIREMRALSTTHGQLYSCNQEFLQDSKHHLWLCFFFGGGGYSYSHSL